MHKRRVTPDSIGDGRGGGSRHRVQGQSPYRSRERFHNGPAHRHNPGSIRRRALVRQRSGPAGEPLYQAHCGSCHRPDASGTPNWKEPGPDGNYPPPPLDGTAHAWHHPLSALRRTVQRGGVPLGGVMPGFSDKLNQPETDAILAWVQSHWDDRIYAIWSERDAQSRSARR